MEESTNTTVMTEQQSDAAPAEKGDRLFTQDELNKIISERLSREREKLSGENEALSQREQALTERENKLTEQENELKSRAEELDRLNAQIAELNLHEKKIDYLVQNFGATRQEADAAARILKGDTLGEFKESAKTLASPPPDREDNPELHEMKAAPNSVDAILRKAFGLSKKKG